MIGSREIVNEINKILRDTWTDDEWKIGKQIRIDKKWAGRLKFITERYTSAGWVVKKTAEISSLGERHYFLNFKNPMSFKATPPEIRDTGVN
jgi:hypothetical protein